MRTITIELSDNGKMSFSPDLAKNDGIFSGAFIPRNDDSGFYTIQVYVHHTGHTKDAESVSSIRKHGMNSWIPNLMPDSPETWFGCGSDNGGCWSFTPNFDFYKSTQYRGLLQLLYADQTKVC